MAAIDDNLKKMVDAGVEMQSLRHFSRQAFFRVEGIDLNIPTNLIPQQLSDKLRNDFNAALTRAKQAAAELPNSV